MAHFNRCDNCGMEAETRGQLRFNPDGWIQASERVPLTEDRYYMACSPVCMGALMAKRVREILDAETAAHAEVAQGSER